MQGCRSWRRRRSGSSAPSVAAWCRALRAATTWSAVSLFTLSVWTPHVIMLVNLHRSIRHGDALSHPVCCGGSDSKRVSRARVMSCQCPTITDVYVPWLRRTLLLPVRQGVPDHRPLRLLHASDRCSSPPAASCWCRLATQALCFCRPPQGLQPPPCCSDCPCTW